MSEAVPAYVIDTSAWFTLIEDEAGSDTVQEILEQAQAGEAVVLVSFMSFVELYYVTAQERDEAEALARVGLTAALPVLRVESTETLGIRAGELKAAHRISVADAWIAALAKERGATLVHKDPEFRQVEGAVEVLELPYKAGDLLNDVMVYGAGTPPHRTCPSWRRRGAWTLRGRHVESAISNFDLWDPPPSPSPSARGGRGMQGCG